MHVMVDLEFVCVDNLFEDFLIDLRCEIQLVEANLMVRWG